MPSPKNAEANRWFVRVDGDSEVLRPKVTEFAQRIDVVSLLAVHHLGSKKENPHIHMCIEMLNSIQKQSFALQIKKHFAVVNRGYALDVWDGQRSQGAPTYLFHEMGDVFVHKGWQQSEMDYVAKMGYEIAHEVSLQKTKASQKLVERALLNFEGKQPSTLEILYFMMSEIHDQTAYHPGTFKLKSFVEEVEIKLTPANQLNSLVLKYYNSMFRI